MCMGAPAWRPNHPEQAGAKARVSFWQVKLLRNLEHALPAGFVVKAWKWFKS